MVIKIFVAFFSQRYVIGEILSAQSREVIVENIHSKLIEIREKVAADEIDMDMYEIHKVMS